MISALFVRKDSIYKNLGIDCWDIDRNALNFSSSNVIIAHPPCRAWGKLSHFAKPREGERELALWVVDKIRQNGGILEHPRASRLWKEKPLPMPNEQNDEFGGFSICIDQSWFGHKARKTTLLYICGCEKKQLPLIPISFDQPTHVVSCSKSKYRKSKPEITKKEREATPINLANWMIDVCKIISENKTKISI